MVVIKDRNIINNTEKRNQLRNVKVIWCMELKEHRHPKKENRLFYLYLTTLYATIITNIIYTFISKMLPSLVYVTSVRISNTSLFVQHAFFNSIWFILSRRPQIINITSQSQFHMLYRNDNVERMTRESQWSFSKWELLPGCYRLPNYSWLG
jgi:hypothetical protein